MVTFPLDSLIGALASVAVIMGSLLDWLFGVNAFKVPLGFVWSVYSTSRNPKLGPILLVIGILGLLSSVLKVPQAFRVALGIVTIAISLMFFVQANRYVSLSSIHIAFTRLVGAGPWVTLVAGVALAFSPLFGNPKRRPPVSQHDLAP